ncbi:hypothetical protein Tco_0787014, partial [Tanacetum coccineum]
MFLKNLIIYAVTQRHCRRGKSVSPVALGPTSSLGIIVGERIPYEASPASIPQRQVAGDTFPQRHVAGENPDMSPGKRAIVVVKPSSGDQDKSLANLVLWPAIRRLKKVLGKCLGSLYQDDKKEKTSDKVLSDMI